jgi:hypothetical protein
MSFKVRRKNMSCSTPQQLEAASLPSQAIQHLGQTSSVRKRLQKRLHHRKQCSAQPKPMAFVADPSDRWDYLELVADRDVEGQLKKLAKDWFEVHIAGTSFRENIADLADELCKGQVLRLCREPDNEYDSRAIRIETEQGQQLGYVPKAKNKESAEKLDAGCRLLARLQYLKWRDDWRKSW